MPLHLKPARPPTKVSSTGMGLALEPVPFFRSYLLFLLYARGDVLCSFFFFFGVGGGGGHTNQHPTTQFETRLWKEQ